MKYNHISCRSVLCLKGSDSIPFLQGLITADIKDLKPGEIKLSAMLSPQGKIRYLFYIFRTQDAFYLDCSQEQAPSLLKQLLTFKLRAEIELSITDLNVYAGTQEISPSYESLIVAKCDAMSIPGWRALSVLSPDLPGAGDKEWLKQRLHAGVPEMNDIIPDKTIALEANLDCLGAISWRKGCYMGQEVTARSHYRGLIRKRLALVHLQNGFFPSESGTVISESSPPMPLLSRYENLAFIMLPRALWTNAELIYEGMSVTTACPEHFIQAFSS